ncbi:MAG: Gfo/Idh/MocA family oxidoreductase [Planctomyces sp.]|nr:Gfo/Idh/MocA family oxidoreductase [Planctomyces sp.]
MVGLDTSHVPAFVRLINDAPVKSSDGDSPKSPDRNVAVTAAFPGGNPEFPLSRDRLDAFTRQVSEMGVEIVDSLSELISRVDGVMIQSVDGTQHLDQARHSFEAGKPVFIDKPLAASFSDVLAIQQLGRRTGVPWFSASAMRYSPGYPELHQHLTKQSILAATTSCPLKVGPGHPDLFWYGVHGVDLLYSILGTGCQQVQCVSTGIADLVTGIWQNGRIGSCLAIRDESGECGFGATVFTDHGSHGCHASYDYGPIVDTIVSFFLNGKSPVPEIEMVEVFAFMAAAEISRKRLGEVVELTEILQNGD